MALGRGGDGGGGGGAGGGGCKTKQSYHNSYC